LLKNQSLRGESVSVAVSQLLLLYGWFALAALLLLIMLISRFYQRFSGENTRYRLFLIPIIGFGAAAVRYASIDRISGDPLADGLSALSGVCLFVLALQLHRQMTVGRP
jgi:type II secretory pathway component PulF